MSVIRIGDLDGASVNVGAAGNLTTGSAILGNTVGQGGSLILSGPTASWTSDFVNIGFNGVGQVTLGGGATGSSASTNLGTFSGSSGTLLVDGENTSWTGRSSGTVIGDQGTGALIVRNRADAADHAVNLGHAVTGVGTVAVDGAGTTWSITGGALTVGNFGSGQITVSNGANVSTAMRTRIGDQTGSDGTLNLSGTGTIFSVLSQQLAVGHYGSGEVNLTAGAVVNADTTLLGWQTSGSGTLDMSGIGTRFQGSNYFMIGYDGDGEATVSRGAELQISGALGVRIADRAGSTGTLNIGAASGETAVAAGAIDAATVRFGAGTGKLVFNHTGNPDGSDLIFSPVINGSGSILQHNGTTVLTADNSGFLGTTTISGGQLVIADKLGGSVNVTGGNLTVDGILSGAMTIGSGGRLDGSGTSGSAVIASGGVAAPGNSIGTLNIVGDITFDPGSVYEVEVSPGGVSSDLIAVTGTATLSGGTVRHIGETGSYSPTSSYTILTATGGVAGQFDSVLSNYAFLDPTLAYGSNDVTLTLLRNNVSFVSVANTPNQAATAAAVETLGSGSQLYDTVAMLDVTAARNSYDQLSGEVHASALSSLSEDSQHLRNVMNERLLRGAGTTTTGGSPDFWIKAFGARGELEADGNAASVDRSVGGFFFGGDFLATDIWHLGFVGGYSRSNFDVDERLSSGDTDSYHIGTYAGARWGQTAFRSGVAYSLHNMDTNRTVDFPGFNDRLTAGYDGHTFQAYAEIAHELHIQATSVEPYANLAYVSVQRDRFDETGGAAAITASSEGFDTAYGTFGLRFSHDLGLADLSAKASGTVGWRHAFGDISPRSEQMLSGVPFVIYGAPIDENVAVFDLGLDFALNKNSDLSLSYAGQLGSESKQHGVAAKLQVRF